MLTKELCLGVSLISGVTTTYAETQFLFPLKRSLQGAPVIVNGEVANAADYPASFRSGSKNRPCTWFFVGEQALIGAAHCVVGKTPDDPIDDLKIQNETSEHSAVCTISKDYWSDLSRDWAICKVSPSYTLPVEPNSAVTGFEVVNSKSNIIQGNTLVEISGFGCTANGGIVESEYRIGKAKIVGLPPQVLVAGSTIATPNAIKIWQSPSILCAGDSGGPAFLYQKKLDRIHRVVIGVNSSSNIDAGVSYLASTSTLDALTFFRGWAKDNQVKICGIETGYTLCRPFVP